jgi:hypothetical protein
MIKEKVLLLFFNKKILISGLNSTTTTITLTLINKNIIIDYLLKTKTKT